MEAILDFKSPSRCTSCTIIVPFLIFINSMVNKYSNVTACKAFNAPHLLFVNKMRRGKKRPAVALLKEILA